METCTFTDPRTGEEIESTRLARRVARLISAPVGALRLAAICVMAGAPVFVLCAQFHLVTPWGAVFWTTVGALFGGTLIFGWEGYRRGQSVTADLLHDAIARRQHQQRLAALERGPQVPLTALSLASPPRPPTPEDSALSRNVPSSLSGDGEEPGSALPGPLREPPWGPGNAG